MNAVDIVLLCCFLPAIYTGIVQGFIRQLFSLAALFLGAYIAYEFSGMLVGFVPGSWNIDKQVLDIILFTLTFLLTMLGVNLLGKLIKKIVQISMLGWLDRLLGTLFSLAKAAIILSVLILLIETLDGIWPFLPKEDIGESRLFGPIKDIAPTLFPYIRSFFA